jgi:hypothetical protein
MRPQQRGDQEIATMDGKLALFYFIIIGVFTLFYSDGENVDRMKHAITGLAVAQVQAAAE